jgi:hypothetical protein
METATVATCEFELNPEVFWRYQRLCSFCPFYDTDSVLTAENFVQPQADCLLNTIQPVEIDVMKNQGILMPIVLSNQDVAWADEVLPCTPTPTDPLSHAGFAGAKPALHADDISTLQ